MKLDAKEFSEAIRQINPNLFLVCASFEDRCLSSASIVSAEVSASVIIFRTDRGSERLEKNYGFLLALEWSGEPTVVLTNSSDGLRTSDAINVAISNLSSEMKSSIVVDISTFPHEHLAILVNILHSHNLLSSTYFAYVSVSTYGGNKVADQLWLSKGVSNIRPIVGFPGRLRPSRPLHLVALVGFEYERIRVAIEESEPYFVSLGVGEKKESVTEDHHGNNQEFLSRLSRFLEDSLVGSPWVQRFEFSCVSPGKTQKQILELVSKYPEYNVVVFPMNTKISTLGAVIAGLSNRSIQLAYVEPVEYNTESYSNGIDGFRLFNGSSFLLS